MKNRSIPDLDALRKLSRGNPEIRIAVLDGAVDLTHPVFAGADLEQIEVESSLESHASEHGTHVASLIFGQPGTLIEGIAPRCRGLIVPIFFNDSLGRPCDQERLANAIHQAVDRGAHVINISGGELMREGNLHLKLLEAVERCAAANVLIVAAAGNDGCDCAQIPAALPSVLAVGAADEEGRPLAASNWGGAVRAQGVLAPGEEIPGAVPGGGIRALSGTSFAASIVSGTAALLLSLQHQNGKTPDPLGIRKAILASADPCLPSDAMECLRSLAGRLNPLRAAQALLKGGTKEMMNTVDPSSGPSAAPPSVEAPVGLREEPVFLELEPAPSWPPLQPAGAIAPVQSAAPRSSQIQPACACGGGGTASYLAYPVGNLSYDFGSESRLRSFRDLMGKGSDPFDHRQMAHYLRHKHPYAATQLTWIIHIDREPIYAILPSGAYAQAVHRRFIRVLVDQLKEGKDKIERIVVPGFAGAKARLANGQELPVLQPDFRGWGEWNTSLMAAHLQTLLAGCTDKRAEIQDQVNQQVKEIVTRLLSETRNRGAQPRDRALNFAATSNVKVLSLLVDPSFILDSIKIEASSFCVPGSDCWSADFTFFHKVKPTTTPRKVVRLVLDVSDTVPSLLTTETWFIPPST